MICIHFIKKLCNVLLAFELVKQKAENSYGLLKRKCRISKNCVSDLGLCGPKKILKGKDFNFFRVI